MYSSLGATASAVPCRQPSSTNECVQSRAAKSHTYTLPLSVLAVSQAQNIVHVAHQTSKRVERAAVGRKGNRVDAAVHLQRANRLLRLQVHEYMPSPPCNTQTLAETSRIVPSAPSSTSMDWSGDTALCSKLRCSVLPVSAKVRSNSETDIICAPWMVMRCSAPCSRSYT